MIEKLFASLCLTLIIELLYAAGWRVKGKDLWLIVGMNILTNPLVVLWNSWMYSHGYLISTLLPELAAITTEAVLLKRFGKNISYPVLLAVCINVFSYVLGLFINFL